MIFQASDTVSTEDRPAEAGQHMEQAARLTVRAGQYDRAADLLHNTLSLYSEAGVQGTMHGRVVLALVIVQEKRGDSVAASKVGLGCIIFCSLILTFRCGLSGVGGVMGHSHQLLERLLVGSVIRMVTLPGKG